MNWCAEHCCPGDVCEHKHDEIDHLRAENRRLRAQRDKLLEVCEVAWTDYGIKGDISATSLEKMEEAIAAGKERP